MSKHHSAEEDFLITDPEKHPGVILEVPAGVKPVRLEPIGYAADTMVRCAFCPPRREHLRGFFAVLPDGGLALCGNCCAIKIAGKATVAEIRRDVKKQMEVAAARKDIALLATGLAPVIEILERDWVPIEKEVHDSVRCLNECFMSVKLPSMSKLTTASTGLKAIISAASTGPANLVEIKRKRSLALNFIEQGVKELREELSKLDPMRVKNLVKTDNPVHGFYRTRLDGRSLLVLDCPSWSYPDEHENKMVVHMQLPKIHLADQGPLMEAVEVARLAAA